MTRTGIPDGSSICAIRGAAGLPGGRGLSGRAGTIHMTRRESAHHRQFRAVLHPPQQISPGGGRRLPQLPAVEPAVGDDEHARPEIGKELSGQARSLIRHAASRAATTAWVPHSPGHHAHLREWRGVFLAPGPAEGRVILFCVGNVEHEPVNGHQPAGAKPGALGAPLRAGNCDPFEQQLQWRCSQSLTRLRDGPRSGDLPVLLPCPGKCKPATSRRITSSYASPKNRHRAST